MKRLETNTLLLTLKTETACWNVLHKPGGVCLQGQHPAFDIEGLSVALPEYTVTTETIDTTDCPFGDCAGLRLSYQKPGALDIAYTVLLSTDGNDVITRLDFVNRTGKPLTINRTSTMADGQIHCSSPATLADVRAIGDQRQYREHYVSANIMDVDQLDTWWYAAIKDMVSGRSVLMGHLTNNKGLGQFCVKCTGPKSVKLSDHSDYEGICMPVDAQITGEWVLLNFGKKGTDSLERFGDLIAVAHDIDLMKQHPLDPYDPTSRAIFNRLNTYGAGVVRDFPYEYDRSQGDNAYNDRAWTKACMDKVYDVGLDKFGYAPFEPVNLDHAQTPLVRNYGKPDFWFPEAKEIAENHPEFYVNDRADFSNPGLIALEEERAAESFEGKTGVIQYGWDFANNWRKLDGQHDAFMTSAETYHAGMRPWRERTRAYGPGAYAWVCMNDIGLSYGTADILRIGQDSDRAYNDLGRDRNLKRGDMDIAGCNVVDGLLKQASGRYFYNGRVWWNHADAFHTWIGGLYSYGQAKVHATFCAIAGNVINLGEPLANEEIPEDRMLIIRRVAPMTPDVATAVDVFEHSPARLWSIPVKRDFGQWHIAALFSFDEQLVGETITQEVCFKDLGLSADADYLVYEFWSDTFLGVKKRRFERTIKGPDCEVYAIVPKQERPTLVSTSRHVRHMAYDIKLMQWDADTNTLSGTSAVVENYPHVLSVYVPSGYTPVDASAGDLDVHTEHSGNILKVRFQATRNCDVDWVIEFAR